MCTQIKDLQSLYAENTAVKQFLLQWCVLKCVFAYGTLRCCKLYRNTSLAAQRCQPGQTIKIQIVQIWPLNMFGQFYKFEDFEFICHGLFFIFGQIFVDQFTEDMLIHKSTFQSVTQLLLRTLQRSKRTFVALARDLDRAEALLSVVSVSNKWRNNTNAVLLRHLLT